MLTTPLRVHVAFLRNSFTIPVLMRQYLDLFVLGRYHEDQWYQHHPAWAMYLLKTDDDYTFTAATQPACYDATGAPFILSAELAAGSVVRVQYEPSANDGPSYDVMEYMWQQSPLSKHFPKQVNNKANRELWEARTRKGGTMLAVQVLEAVYVNPFAADDSDPPPDYWTSWLR